MSLHKTFDVRRKVLVTGCDTCNRKVPHTQLFSLRLYDTYGKRHLRLSICPWCAARVPGSGRIKELDHFQQQAGVPA